MKFIGAHVSAAGGIFNVPLNASEIGANAFSFFTKNQRQWSAPFYSKETVTAFHENMSKTCLSYNAVIAHSSYLINLGDIDVTKRKRSYEALKDELKRCEVLQIPFLNIHPGSHLNKIPEKECINIISREINKALSETKSVTVLLENTAGQGTNMGFKFEHLAAIIKQIKDTSRIGVCYDTCHGFAAGYDIRTEKSYAEVMENFDKIIGSSYLKGVHVNDSKHDLGSSRDRHASLGKGFLGINTFKNLMRDERLSGIPFILETPSPELWPKEIKLLRQM